MRRVAAVALASARELRRGAAAQALLAALALVLLIAPVLGDLSYGANARVCADLGLAGLSLFGVVLAAVGGAWALAVELDGHQASLVLARPVQRWEFVLGRYAGLLAVLLLWTALGSGLLALALAWLGSSPSPALARAELLVALELAAVAAIGVLCGSWARPFPAVLLTLGAWALGRASDELAALAGEPGPVAAGLWALAQALPDFRLFYASGLALPGGTASIHGEFVAWSYVAAAGLHALGWTALALVVACAVFTRRDLS